nr:prolyl oligopeptidase family serine peptidase [Sciscionella sp. SE31]
MSAWLITQDQRFAAAVPMAPVTNWYSQHHTSNLPCFDQIFLAADPHAAGGRYHDRSPVMFAGRVRTPTLRTTGLDDRCTPPPPRRPSSVTRSWPRTSTRSAWPTPVKGTGLTARAGRLTAQLSDGDDRRVEPRSSNESGRERHRGVNYLSRVILPIINRWTSTAACACADQRRPIEALLTAHTTLNVPLPRGNWGRRSCRISVR